VRLVPRSLPQHYVKSAEAEATFRGDRRSVLLNASASRVSCTPAVGSALLAHSSSGLADTVNHYPARATAHAGLGNHAVRLMKLGEGHGLCSRSQCQPEHNNSYCSGHSFLPVSTTDIPASRSKLS
jgi:hypothetical protein